MDKYSGLDNHGRPKADYLHCLTLMSIETLEDETRNKIWLSAYAGNNPRSDYHWHINACYDEIVRRTGHNLLYYRCYDNVLKEVRG